MDQQIRRKAGETMVVRGGRPAWSNPGPKVAVLATVGVADAAST
jgi:hypothetical protein